VAVSMIYGIPRIISFKQYIMCGPWVYCYRFTKYVVFPMGLKGLRVSQDSQVKDKFI